MIENYNKYYSLFRKMIDSIGSSEQVRIINSDMRYLLKQSNEQIDISGDVQLPDAVKRFYQSIEFAKCEWTLKQDAEKIVYLDKEIDMIRGAVNIVTKQQMTKRMVDGNKSNILDPYRISAEKTEDLERLVPFDYLTSDLAACLKIDNDKKVPDRMFLILFSDGIIHDLQIGIDDYLETGIKCKFFYGWQQGYFLDDKKRMTLIEHYLKQLF